jgi:hypothetical protein
MRRITLSLLPRALFLLVTAVYTAASPDTCSLATRYSTDHDFASASPLWEAIVSSSTLTSDCPHALVFHGVSLLTSGDVRGGDFLDRAVSLDPTDYIAHSFLGAIHEKLAREAHLTERNATLPLLTAISHFKAALAYRSLPRTKGPYPQGVLARPLTYLYRSLGSCFLWSGQREAAAALHKEAVAGGEVGWTNEWARPTIPLPLRPPFPLPFIPRGSHPAVDALLGTLEGHLAQIREEYQAYHRHFHKGSGGGGGGSGGGWQRESGGLETSGGWQVLTLAVDGRVNATLCQSFPTLCSLLQASPLALSTRSGQTKFSVLQPGASILPHAGPTVARLRVHCTLQGFAPGPVMAVLRVGEASQGWREGVCFVFDESFEHEVAGVGGEGGGEGRGGVFKTVDVGVQGGGDPGMGKHPRVVLLVDIPNPFLASLADFKKHAVSDLGWKTHGKELKGLWKALSN